jgi:hypothetical protein
MTDIVERLRNWERVDIVDAHEDGALYNAAADEIERLLAALKAIAATADWKTQLTISNDALEGK